MPFQKGNKLAKKKYVKRPLGKEVIGLRGYEGQKESLASIPDWQEKLREYIDHLIKTAAIASQLNTQVTNKTPGGSHIIR